MSGPRATRAELALLVAEAHWLLADDAQGMLDLGITPAPARYDVTTPYFEAEKEDDLRKVGYSEECRVDPHIVTSSGG